MPTELAIVVSPRGWAEQLHRHVADHGGALVRARVLDAREAVDERFHVLVAEDLTSFLTPRLVAELQAAGRRVLGVYDPTEPWGRERLDELGVDATVTCHAAPEEILRIADGLADAAVLDLDAELWRLAGAPAATAAGGSSPAAAAGGRRVVVAGPAGSPGRTEVAVALAAVLDDAVLVDADVTAPSVAQRLGLAPHPNLRTAIDAVEQHSGRLDGAVQTAGAVPAVCGLPDARAARDVRSTEVAAVLEALALRHRAVVVDVGASLEDVPTNGPEGRFAITRSLVAGADVVVAVASPSPVGLTRLLSWLADARALTDVPMAVVFNRVRRSARYVQGELEDELRRTLDPPLLAFAPEDRRVATAAWEGRLVGRGAFVRSVGRLAVDLDELVRRVHPVVAGTT